MHKKNNLRLLLVLLTIGIGMLGMAYAFVPMYRWFCSVIGIAVPEIAVGRAGTPKPAAPADGTPDTRQITVRFMGNAANHIPVTLKPIVPRVTVNPGQPVLTAYKADNHSNQTLTGIAVHTILALGPTGGERDVSEHIDLQQCFCFEEQTYPGGEEVTLPLSFHVAPTLPDDVHTIHFNYTLFEAE